MKQFKIWFKSIAVAFFDVFQNSDAAICLEVGGYEISPLFLPVDRCIDRCSGSGVVSDQLLMADVVSVTLCDGSDPLLVTGGFHVDGFLDTCDALHSYQSMEKKQEILKDPHIGAFAVLSLLTAVLLGLGFYL